MEGKNYTSEYLLIFSEERKLMQNEEDLIRGLQLNQNLRIEKKGSSNTITFHNTEFSLNVKKIKSKNEAYRSYVIDICNLTEVSNEKEKLAIRDLNKEVIATIRELQHSQLNTLRDDLATEFSIEGYKHIHEIENKMRKLITIFMSTKVGLEWIKSNIPQEVIDSIKNKDVKSETQSLNTFLSETDFIQLSKFLFDKYSTIKTADVHRILNSTKKTIDVEKLMDFVPKSNWQRYFSPEVYSESTDSKERNKKEEKLIDDWESLYDLRNKVAHNRFITYEEMRQIISKKNDINEVINEAFNAIEEIEITEQQEAEIKSELKTTIHEKTGESVDISKNDDTDNKSADKKLIADGEHHIRKLTRYIYMNIHDSYKKELRKYRNKLNKAVENYKLSNDDTLTHNLLELELNRVKDYLKTLNAVI
ncbi:hypothetical protein ACVBEK_002637 [Cronobacter malonaticus]